MKHRTYHITGATGGAAISALSKAGQAVRVLAHHGDERTDRLRDQGVQVVTCWTSMGSRLPCAA